jgi:ribosomal-protein-alanine N-acetyltransferase
MELKLDFSPFPTLETDRLILREIKHTDVKEVFFYRSDKEIMKFIPRPIAETEQDALNHIEMIQDAIAKEEGINWGITLKGDDKIIGIAGLYRINKPSFRAEIGYLLDPKHHGKGIISETVQKILEYGFETCNFHTITAIIDPANHASEKVLQRANFEKEAHFKEDFYFNGEFLDSVHYSIINKK